MAYYIRGNRILTQREKDTEDIGGGCAGMILLLSLHNIIKFRPIFVNYA
jgi:hypothetical protein